MDEQMKILIQAAIDIKKSTDNVNAQIKQIVDDANKQAKELKIDVVVDDTSAKQAVQDQTKMQEMLNKSIENTRKRDRSAELKQAQAINKELENEYKLRENLPVLLNKTSSAKSNFQVFLQSLKPIALENYSNEIDNISKGFKNIKTQADLTKVNSSVSAFTSKMKELGYVGKTVLGEALANMGKFASWFFLGGIVTGINRAFFNSIQTLKTVDTLLTEISKTSSLTADELNKLGKESFTIANKFGATATGYLEGVREFSRAGFEESSQDLAEVSLLAQTAGDMIAETANKYILATNAAYKLNGDTTKLNAVLDGQNQVNNIAC